MNFSILLPQDIAPVGKEFLRARGYRLRLAPSIDEATLQREVQSCDAILLRNAHISRAVLEAAPKLRVIGRHGVGVDNVDIPVATRLGIWVTNAPFSNAQTVAEHVLGSLIGLSRHLLQHDRALRQGDFEIRNRQIGNDLAGKTLGIIGLGRIGSLVARKAALGLDMKIIALQRKTNLERVKARAGEEIDAWTAQNVERVEDRETFFRRADFISLHLPATPQTRGSIGARELSWMKSTAYLINTARGEVVDENALFEALHTRRIAGAALDVFATEPPALQNPLFSLENVIVTPHSAALTIEAMERMALHAAQGIDDVLSGRKPQWPVNQPTILRSPVAD